MRLTRKKAIELCIKLWTWCAKTGERKEEWPEWEKYDSICCDCWFCEYDEQKRKTVKCTKCIFPGKKSFRCEDMISYQRWEQAKTPRTRKKYAKLFLAQIKTLQ